MTEPLFERPVQTIKAISQATNISLTPILKACQVGRLGECAYRSGDAWLIDTSGPQFQQWLAAHPTHAMRVKGATGTPTIARTTGWQRSEVASLSTSCAEAFPSYPSSFSPRFQPVMPELISSL